MKRTLVFIATAFVSLICLFLIVGLAPMLLADQPFYPALEQAWSVFVLLALFLVSALFLYTALIAPSSTVARFTRLSLTPLPPPAKVALQRTSFLLLGLLLLGFGIVKLFRTFR